MINLIILSGILLSPFYSELIPIVISAIIIKIFVDLPILAGFITFAKQSKMFIYSIPLIFLYPAYIILTGAMGILVNYRWKGRKIKN
jgi:hypothetical protein